MSTPPAVWLHATTPAEVAPVQVLAAHLAEQRRPPRVLVTGTPENPGPGDDLRAMDALIDAQGLRLVVLAGNLLPVPLIERARARGLGLMLVDAVDPVPTGGWRILPGYTRSILSRFEQIHTRDSLSAAGLRRLARAPLAVLETGMMARFAPARGCNQQELDALRGSLGARPVWLALRLPAAEVPAVLAAHTHALRRAHRLLLIVQPADPDHAAALAAEAAEAGFPVARRALDDEILETTQVYLADGDDDAGLFLRLAPVSYLGGSLTEGAPVAPVMQVAALGSALVFGPNAPEVERDALDVLRVMGGGLLIGTRAELGEAVSHLLVPEVGADVALRAWTLVTAGSEATLAVARAICDWLDLNGGPR